MWVHAWDEISAEWSTLELDIPINSAPEAIAQAVDQACATPVGSVPIGQEWVVKSHTQTRPILTIECRTAQNLLGIIVVNYEEISSREGTPEQLDPPC